MIDESFQDFTAMLDGPLFVVTTQVDGHPSGCLVGFATQTSVHPASFIAALPKDSHTCEAAGRAEYLALHVLPQSKQALAAVFTGEPGDQAHRFARCSWRGGPHAMPILDDAAAWFVARIVSRSEVGDHVVHLLDPVAAWAPEPTEDLLYLFDLDDDLDPGHEAPQGFYGGERNAPKRYGARFTLDVP